VSVFKWNPRRAHSTIEAPGGWCGRRNMVGGTTILNSFGGKGCGGGSVWGWDNRRTKRSMEKKNEKVMCPSGGAEGRERGPTGPAGHQGLFGRELFVTGMGNRNARNGKNRRKKPKNALVSVKKTRKQKKKPCLLAGGGGNPTSRGARLQTGVKKYKKQNPLSAIGGEGGENSGLRKVLPTNAVPTNKGAGKMTTNLRARPSKEDQVGVPYFGVDALGVSKGKRKNRGIFGGG